MNLLKIWKLAGKKPLFALQILLNVCFGIITIIVSDFSRKAVDKGIGQGQLKSVVIQFLILIIVGTILSYVNVLVQTNFSVSLMESFRNKTIDKLLKAKYVFYENETTGSISNRVNRDMGTISDYMSGGMPDFISNMITFVCCFVYLLTINFSMTLMCGICIPMTVWLAKKVAAPTYNTMEKFGEKLDEVMQIAQDTMNNVKIEKLYVLKENRKKYFDANMDEATSYYVKYEKLVAKAGGYKYIIKATPMFICIFVGFLNAYRGTITSGELIAFVLLLKNISSPLSEFATYITDLKEAMVSVDRVMEIIDVSEECFGNGEECEIENVFELKDVAFSYEQKDEESNEEVLSNINMTIKKGKTIALVGASGSGKSTLFKLLIGFHVPTDGQICLYGKCLNDWNIEKARRNMAYVAQDTYLFEGTIAENIAYGKMDATMEEIMVAAQKAYAHDFITNMPEGYQTILSERGNNLSGGQRQRIGIARAFLKDAPVFLLDEMTSALDVESEKYIQKAIEEYSKDRTVILIAHRLTTIKNADEIYVLEQGKIVQKGTHDSLMAKDGVYSMLYSNQENKDDYKEVLS
jgi:ABC-type multidrug transport system fused ATPase/permease subunit